MRFNSILYSIVLILTCAFSQAQYLHLAEVFDFERELINIFKHPQGLGVYAEDAIYLIEGDTKTLKKFSDPIGGAYVFFKSGKLQRAEQSYLDSLNSEIVQEALPYMPRMGLQSVSSGQDVYVLYQNRIFWYRRHPFLKLFKAGRSFRSSYFKDDSFSISASYGSFFTSYGSFRLESQRGFLIDYANGKISEVDDTIYIAWMGLVSSNDSFKTFQEYLPADYRYNQFLEVGQLHGRKYLVRERGIENGRGDLLYKAKITASLFTVDCFYTGDDSGILRKYYHGEKGMLRVKTVHKFEEELVGLQVYQNRVLVIGKHGIYLGKETDWERLVFWPDVRFADAFADEYGNIWFSTYEGLYLYKEQQVDTLINKVEFNQRGMNYFNGLMYAGSTTGLFIWDPQKYDPAAFQTVFKPFRPMDRSMRQAKSQRLWILGTFLFFIVVFGLWLLHRRQKRGNQDREGAKVLGLGAFREAIRANPSINSVKSLAAHFQTYPMELYRFMEKSATTPGNFIREVKAELIEEMLEQGESIHEISKATGYSEGYIRRKFEL